MLTALRPKIFGDDENEFEICDHPEKQVEGSAIPAIKIIEVGMLITAHRGLLFTSQMQ